MKNWAHGCCIWDCLYCDRPGVIYGPFRSMFCMYGLNTKKFSSEMALYLTNSPFRRGVRAAMANPDLSGLRPISPEPQQLSSPLHTYTLISLRQSANVNKSNHSAPLLPNLLSNLSPLRNLLHTRQSLLTHPSFNPLNQFNIFPSLNVFITTQATLESL